MFMASAGGGAATRLSVYRHALVRFMIRSLPSLPAGSGWSPLATALAAILISWDPAPTMAQRFESALAVLDRALPRRRRVGRTYQGLVRALERHGVMLLRALVPHLRGATRRAAGGLWTIGVGGLAPIGVDGSRFDAPRTIANESLGFAGRHRCGPQMHTLLLIHLGVMLPWGFRVARGRTGERAMLRRMLGVLPENTLLVADAGFMGFDLLSELKGRGVHFLVRVGGNTRLLQHLGYAGREGASTVYLWPDQRRRDAPLVLRLIRVGDVHLVTDVTDPHRLSKRAACELYRRRWGLEVGFRSLKQTLERRVVRTRTAAHARHELAWAVIGLWVLGLMGARAIRAAGHAPRRLSIARALSAVRAARVRSPSERALAGRLRRALIDDRPRRAAKKAWAWPHKKNEPPTQPPTIANASPRQVRRAAALRTNQNDV